MKRRLYTFRLRNLSQRPAQTTLLLSLTILALQWLTPPQDSDELVLVPACELPMRHLKDTDRRAAPPVAERSP